MNNNEIDEAKREVDEAGKDRDYRECRFERRRNELLEIIEDDDGTFLDKFFEARKNYIQSKKDLMLSNNVLEMKVNNYRKILKEMEIK